MAANVPDAGSLGADAKCADLSTVSRASDYEINKNIKTASNKTVLNF
jgi:hypothetical protein